MGQNRIDKTNAARLLERAGIRYELIPYRVGKEHLSAAQVAGQLGEPVGRVFKTLVLRGDRTGFFVCVVPGDHEVDLKAAARVSGNKKADLIPVKELLPVTGYIRGGCSPVGMKRAFGHKKARQAGCRAAGSDKAPSVCRAPPGAICLRTSFRNSFRNRRR